MKAQGIFTLLLFSLLLVSCKKKDKTDPTPPPTPPNPLPEVTTNTVSNITASMALCGGNVTGAGTAAMLSVGVCWDTSPSPTTLKPHSNDGAGTGTYTSAITGLQPNTTYYARAYATNYNGTAYGQQVSFKTPATWTRLNAQFNLWSFNAIAGKDNTVTIGNQRSTDQGVNWLAITPTVNFGNIYRMRTIGSTIFAAADLGIFKSADYGSTWSLGNTGLNGPMSDICSLNGILFASNFGTGVYKSTDNGTSWTQVINGLDSLYVVAIVSNGSSIFAGTNGGIYRSSDIGASWTVVNSGLPSKDIRIMTSVGSFVFVSEWTGNLYMTNNNGTSWTSVKNGTTGNPKDFAVNGNTLYLGTNTGIFVTNDNGSTWSTFILGLPAGEENVSSLGATNTDLYMNNTSWNIYRIPL